MGWRLGWVFPGLRQCQSSEGFLKEPSACPHALSEHVVPSCVLGTLATLVSAVSSELNSKQLCSPPLPARWPGASAGSPPHTPQASLVTVPNCMMARSWPTTISLFCPFCLVCVVFKLEGTSGPCHSIRPETQGHTCFNALDP